MVKPDRRPETTASGILIPQAAYHEPPMSGVVMAVGDWPATLKRIWTRAVKDCIDRIEDADSADASDCAYFGGLLGQLLQEAPSPEHHVHVGDRVIFPMEVGHEIVLNEDTDEAYVILPEDSIIAVYEMEAI